MRDDHVGSEVQEQRRNGRSLRPGLRKRITNDALTVLDTVVRTDTEGLTVVFTSEATGETFLMSPKDWGKPFKRPVLDSLLWERRPATGSHWRHYSGGKFRVVANATEVGTGAYFIIYKNDTTGDVWAMPAEHWFAEPWQAGASKPMREQRFELIP